MYRWSCCLWIKTDWLLTLQYKKLFVCWFGFCLLCVFVPAMLPIPTSPSQVMHHFQWSLDLDSPYHACSYHSAVSNPASWQWTWITGNGHSPAMERPLFRLQVASWDQSKWQAKSMCVATRSFLGAQMFARGWYVILGWRCRAAESFSSDQILVSPPERPQASVNCRTSSFSPKNINETGSTAKLLSRCNFFSGSLVTCR